MFVIVTNLRDQPAWSFAARLAAEGVCALTPHDLSMPGWHHHLGKRERATAVVGGREIDVTEIAGVVTRLGGVTTDDLPHIIPPDRGYVAAEMTAFLLSWLSELRCPVLNRPSPGCLVGPAWRQAQWVRAAADLGIPVRPAHRRLASTSDARNDSAAEAAASVTVVGNCCFGAVDGALLTSARRLATAAGVDLLAVYFAGAEADAELVGADFWPDISVPKVADAILAYWRRGDRC